MAPFFTIGSFALIYQLHFWHLKKKWKKHGVADDFVECRLTDQAFYLESASKVLSIGWNQFTRLRESPGSFRLYTPPGVFYVLPKRVIRDPKAMKAVRDLLRQHIPADYNRIPAPLPQPSAL